MIKFTFKKYLEQIRESTADLNKAMDKEDAKRLLKTKVDPKVQIHHDSVFGAGNHHIEIALHNDVPDKVKYHVTSQGDSIEDGQVKLKSGRKVELSKYLPRSKAPKDVQDEHENYQRNKGTGNSKLVISRHPGEVASASTGTHWSSCANLNSNDYAGPAAQAMPKEIHHGTLIAMHVHKDAKPNEHGEYDAKDVIGRTLIKRHHNEDGSSSFHQEGKHYGAFPDTAKAEVDKFTEKHYPIKGGMSAEKESSLYDDDKNPIKLGKNVSEQDITKAINHPNPKVVMTALKHPNATTDHITQVLKNEDSNLRYAAINHPKVNEDHITQALKDKKNSVRRSAIRNIKANESHITTALKDADPTIKEEALKHSKVNEGHITQALKDDDPYIRGDAIKHPKATSKHIDRVLNNKDEDVVVKRDAIKNPNATADHITQALKDPDYKVRRSAIANKNANKDHITTALKDEDSDVRFAAVRHPNANANHYEQALKDEDDKIVNAAKTKLRAE